MMSSFESTAAPASADRFQPDVPGRFNVEGPPSADTGADEASRAQVEMRAIAFEAGQQQGLASAQTRCEPALRALAAATQEIHAQQSEYLYAQRELLAQLAIDIAERIIGHTLGAHPDWILDRITSALAPLEPNPSLRLELSPDDFALVTETTDSISIPEHAQLIENPEFAPGDFLLRNGATSIDSRMTSILEAMRQALSGLEGVAESEGAGGDPS